MAKKVKKTTKAPRTTRKKGHISGLLESHPNLMILLPLFVLSYLLYLFIHTG